MSIAWFVSPHGLGHATRTARILEELSADVPVRVVSRLPDWFWTEQIPSRCVRVDGVFDAGCVQKSTWEIDEAASVAAATAVWKESDALSDRLARELVEWGTRLVVCDIAPLPLIAARKAGIRSLLVANFTWSSIYRNWSGGQEIADCLAEQIALAGATLVPGPAVAMPEAPNQIPQPWIAARGRCRRSEIFGERDPRTRWALVLPGAWDTDFRWEGLAKCRGWRFAMLSRGNAVPSGVTAIDARRFPHADVVTSVDAVVGKPGYGTLGECAAAGTRMVYASRPEFAESAVLEKWIENHGFGVELPKPAFLECRWADALERIASSARPEAQVCDGAHGAARSIAKAWQDSRGLWPK
jgi:hypothetical protein